MDMNALLALPFLINSQLDLPMIEVAVVDSGVEAEYSFVLCDGGKTSKDFTETDKYDYDSHGTNIAGIIWNNKQRKNVCIVNLKYYHTASYGPKNTVKTAIQAFKEAVRLGVDIINFSSSGESYNEEERNVLQTALDRGIVIVVPSGNKEIDLDKNCTVYPACYSFENKNFHIVARNDADALEKKDFGFGSIVTDYEDGYKVNAFGYVKTGTSQATAKVTARLINQMVKVNIPKRQLKRTKK